MWGPLTGAILILVKLIFIFFKHLKEMWGGTDWGLTDSCRSFRSVASVFSRLQIRFAFPIVWFVGQNFIECQLTLNRYGCICLQILTFSWNWHSFSKNHAREKTMSCEPRLLLEIYICINAPKWPAGVKQHGHHTLWPDIRPLEGPQGPKKGYFGPIPKFPWPNYWYELVLFEI